MLFRKPWPSTEMNNFKIFFRNDPQCVKKCLLCQPERYIFIWGTNAPRSHCNKFSHNSLQNLLRMAMLSHPGKIPTILACDHWNLAEQKVASATLQFWSRSSKGFQRLIRCRNWCKIHVYQAEPLKNELIVRRKWSDSELQLQTYFAKNSFFTKQNSKKVILICWGISHTLIIKKWASHHR